MKRKVGRDFSGDLRHDIRHDRQSAMYGSSNTNKRERLSPGHATMPRSPNYPQHGSYHSSSSMGDRLKRRVVEVSHRGYSSDRHRREMEQAQPPRLKLKITNLPRDRDNTEIENKLYYIFKKFGQASPTVHGFDKSRYAVVVFKHGSQCREAKSYSEQNTVYVFDRPVNVEYFHSNYRDDMDDIGSDDSNDFDTSRGRDNRRQYPSRVHQEDDYSSNVRRRQDWKQGRRTVSMTSNRTGGGGSSSAGGGGGGGSGTTSGYYHNQQQQMEFLEDVPNRTLFIGNLDTSISNYELRRIFGRYTVIDMDVKRHRGQFVGYAFIKLGSIREADIAKSEMDGNVLGKNRIKIGYGKVYPSKRLWLGALGSWINEKAIEQECDRFGALRGVDYDAKSKVAEVEFASLDASKAAFEELTNNCFGRSGRHVEVEYVDTQHQYFTATTFRERQQQQQRHYDNDDDHGSNSRHDAVDSRSRRDDTDYYNNQRSYDRSSTGHRDDYHQRTNPSVPRGRSEERRQEYMGRRSSNRKPYSPRSSHEHRPSSAGGKSNEWPPSPRRSSSSYSNYDEPARHRERREYTPEEESIHNDDEPRDNREESEWAHEPQSPSNDQSNTIMRASADKESPTEYEGHSVPEGLSSFVLHEKFKHWDTSFLLKSSKFLTRLFFVSGSMEFADTIMDMIDWSNSQSPFRITQRLRLDGEKLGEVNKRIENAGRGNFCYALAMDRNEFSKDEISPEEENSNLTGREFRNLVMYLRQKEAAGVVMLQMADNVECIVHVFPPCQFSNQHLMEAYPRINEGYLSQDHLLLIMVKVF